MKTIKSPIETVNIYFQSLATGDFNLLGSVLDENIVWHQPGQGVLSGTYHGKSEVLKLFSKFMEISQGTFKINKVNQLMANGNLVSATLQFSAQKPDSAITMDGVDIMKVENGMITEVFLFSSDQPAEDVFWN